jgi:cytochrome P450
LSFVAIFAIRRASDPEEESMSLQTSPSAPPAIVERFDPFSAEYLADLYPILRALRETTGAFYSSALDLWVVTHYADVRHILTTTRSFSAVNSLEPLTKLCPHAVSLLKEGGYAATPALTNLDPPGHARQRRLANAAFTPKRIAALEPFMRDLARRFLYEHFRDGSADIIADLAWAFPALVLFRVLGLPESDLDRVKRGARHRGTVIYGRASEDEQIEAVRELASFWRYAAALVEARTQSPGDDFVSALTQAGAADGDGDALSREETISIMLQMLFAGHETTTKLMGNSFRRLLEDRVSWEAICRDPDLIPNAIEEVLRFDGSVVAWRHKTKEPVEIGELRLPKDTKLLLLLASANRDPAVFPDPDRFDIHRPNAREHLSFGVGVHNCLGAPLARLEARIVLEEVSRRLPSLRLTENAKLNFPASISMRGPVSLPVAW